MKPCACGHPPHHHLGSGGICATLTISGPPTPKAYWGAAAELHIGRTLTHCQCSHHTTPSGS